MPKTNKDKVQPEVYDVMPGSKIISAGAYNILIGSPLEVVKVIIGRKLPIPTHVVFPDNTHIGSVPQNSTEFLIYYFLFGYQGLAKGLQLTLIGTEKQVKCNLELLRIAFLGLTEEEMITLNIDPEIIDILTKEEHFYRLKNKDDNPLELSDMFVGKAFNDNGIIKLDGVVIKKAGFNKFEVIIDDKEKISIDVNVNQEQIPPYNVPKRIAPFKASKFSVEIIGGSSGFSPINPCSGLVVNYNSSCVLIDPIPYLDFLLKARGISKTQIDACFITHIHDDHCVLLPFLFHSRKMKIITTPEIYYMSLYKLALTLNIEDAWEMDKYFEFIPVKADEEYIFRGLKIKPHYTLHPIPTVGATFTYTYNEKEYNFIYVGDNQSLAIIDGMYDKGIISSERKNKIKDLYREAVDLIIADGGLGMIHGDPRDGKDSKAENIAFIHLDELPEDYKGVFNLASTGKVFDIVSGRESNIVTKIAQYISNLFREDVNPEWIPHLVDYDNILTYNKGDVIIRQGHEEKPGAFIVLSGHCKVVIKKEKKIDYITELDAGDIVGEIALIKEDDQRTATIIADTPVSLCKFHPEAFKTFGIEKELLFKLSNVWSLRMKFSKIVPFSKFPNSVNTAIARISTEEIYGNKHQITIDENNDRIYIVLDGSGTIKKRNGEQALLKKGSIFGDMTLLFGNVQRYEVLVDSYLHCVVIETELMMELMNDTPILHYHLNTVTKPFFEDIIRKPKKNQ